MRALCIVLLACGCNTGAELDVATEEVAGVGIVGAHGACDGEGHALSVVLINQGGGAVRIGGARVPETPPLSAFAFEDVRVDGRPTEVEVVEALTFTAGFDEPVTVALDRSGVACGALPTGPWLPRCNFSPCGAGEDRCDIATGCCQDDRVCVGLAEGTVLRQACIEPSSGCACGPREACNQGRCVPRLFGAVDPEDELVQLYAATLSRLLDESIGRLAKRVPAALAVASSEAGLQVLGGGPVARFEVLEAAIGDTLLPPFGRASLLPNLAGLPADDAGAVLSWALTAGATTDLSSRAPHLFAALDSAVLSDTDDAAFVRAACETGGSYLRMDPDGDNLDTVAGIWLPAAARNFVRLRLRFDPPPLSGPRRFQGTIVLDVEAATRGGRPDEASVSQAFDVVMGGAP